VGSKNAVRFKKEGGKNNVLKIYKKIYKGKEIGYNNYMRKLKALVCLIVLTFTFFQAFPSPAMCADESQVVAAGDDSMDPLARDLILMAIYGTMSGVIIGAASLAFVSRPLTKLRRIAIGASLGLYVGILLGGLVAVDRTIGSGGGSIFDLPNEEEEIPIVRYKDNELKFSFPTLFAMQSVQKIENEPERFEEKLWLGASLLKVTF